MDSEGKKSTWRLLLYHIVYKKQLKPSWLMSDFRFLDSMGELPAAGCGSPYAVSPPLLPVWLWVSVMSLVLGPPFC